MADTPDSVRNTARPTLWEAHPRAAILATVGAVAIVGTLAVVGLEMAGLVSFFNGDALYESDEAPIRVRNGSIDLFLESGTERWEPVGGSDNWKSTGTGKLPDDKFYALITIKSGGSCTNGNKHSSQTVVVTYDNGATITIQANSQRTLVRPKDATLTVHPDDEQRLMYAQSGFIKTVTIGPTNNPVTTCTFADAGQLDNVRLRAKP
jgi:hypothetical protein